MRRVTLSLLCAIFLAAYVGQARIVETLRSPKLAEAATLTKATTHSTIKVRVDKRPKVTRKKTDLQNGQAFSDAEIKSILEHTPNGQYLLPHYKAVGASCRKWNVNPLLAIGMFQMECNLGKTMIKGTNNYGNLRRNSEGFKPSGTPPVRYIRIGRGPHAVFRTPADGINAYCWVLRHVYLDRGRTTLSSIIKVYAPKDDGNKPASYARVVNKFVTKNAAK